MKGFAKHSSSVLIVLGLGVALWPLGQIAYARWNQRALHMAWNQAASHVAHRASPGDSGESASNARGVKVAPANAKKPKSKAAPPKAIRRAWPPTRILIPDIGLDAVVVQGMDVASLERGPGHAPASVLPGEAGNCAIAAHRNVFGSWFLRVDELLPGSRISLQTPTETFHYEVLQSLIVPDNDTRVLRTAPGQEATPQLTLITCTLPRTTTRIAVIAQLVPPDDAY